MGISRLLVAPYAPAQGTVVRSDLDCNNTFFRSRSRTMAVKVALKLYRWKMQWSVDWDRALIGAPKDALKAKVRPPRSITADVGHNSEATINEYNAGARTLQDIYLEAGEDLEEKMDERDAAYQMAKAKSDKSGTPISYLLPPPKQAAPSPFDKPHTIQQRNVYTAQSAMSTPFSCAEAQGNGDGHTNRLELAV
jgi:hypothetical protein